MSSMPRRTRTLGLLPLIPGEGAAGLRPLWIAVALLVVLAAGTARVMARRGLTGGRTVRAPKLRTVSTKRPVSVRNGAWPESVEHLDPLALRGLPPSRTIPAPNGTGVFQSDAPEISSMGTGMTGTSAIRVALQILGPHRPAAAIGPVQPAPVVWQTVFRRGERARQHRKERDVHAPALCLRPPCISRT